MVSATNIHKYHKSHAQRESEEMSKFLRRELNRIRKSGTRAEAVKILHEAGIVDRKGKLNPIYR